MAVVIKSLGTGARDYTTVGSLNSDWTTIVAAADDVTIEMYDDGIMTETASTFNQSVPGVGGTVKFTKPSGQLGSLKHVQIGNGQAWKFVWGTVPDSMIFEYIDIALNKTTTAFSAGIQINKTSAITIFRNLSIHDLGAVAGSSHSMFASFISQPGAVLSNWLVYDIDGSNTSSSVRGIVISNTGDSTRLLNITIERVKSIGIKVDSGAVGVEASNCVIFNVNTAFSNSDAGGWAAASNNNASDDTTGPGANTLDNLTASNQFGSLIDGSEDYSLIQGASLIFSGKDLSADVPNDIVDNKRIIPMSIGAYDIPFFATFRRLNGMIASGIHRRVD